MKNWRNACDSRLSLLISLEVRVLYSFIFQCSQIVEYTADWLKLLGEGIEIEIFNVLYIKRFSLDFFNHSLHCYVDFRAISMGQGQEVHARKLVGSFMQNVSLVYIDHWYHRLLSLLLNITFCV